MFEWLVKWWRSLFWSREVEIAVVGVQASGKTSLVHALVGESFSDTVAPTVGFNMRQTTRGSVNFKLWDLSGQPKFRPTWTRYCLGVDVLLYVVDSADAGTFAVARDELHSLLKELPRVPVLVLGNKSDLTPHATNLEMIRALDLRTINDREVSFYSISAKSQANLDKVVAWLEKRS